MNLSNLVVRIKNVRFLSSVNKSKVAQLKAFPLNTETQSVSATCVIIQLNLVKGA